MKISASIRAAATTELSDSVRQMEALDLDMWHLDCETPAQLAADLAQLRPLSKLPVDLHAIDRSDAGWWPLIVEGGVEYACFQLESLSGPVNRPADFNGRFGMAVMTATDPALLEPYREQIDFILLMTTTPGQSGGRFDHRSFKRIYELRRRFPGKQIHVDGGINDEVSFILRNMGVQCAVSGSFLMGNPDPGSAMIGLKLTAAESSYRVRDWMMDLEDLPVLSQESADFASAVRAIDQHGLGFCCYTDETGKLKGITSNADLRKGILSRLGQLDDIRLADITNESPVCVDADATTQEMLRLIRSLSFIILFLPVTDREGNLCGAVSFNQLIRGES